jgi:hypothetical protein
LVVSASVDWLGAGGSSLVPNRTSHRPSWSDSLNHLLLWVLLQSPFFGGKRWGSEQQQSNIISSLTFSLRPRRPSFLITHPQKTNKQTNKRRVLRLRPLLGERSRRAHESRCHDQKRQGARDSRFEGKSHRGGTVFRSSSSSSRRNLCYNVMYGVNEFAFFILRRTAHSLTTSPRLKRKYEKHATQNVPASKTGDASERRSTTTPQRAPPPPSVFRWNCAPRTGSS